MHTEEPPANAPRSAEAKRRRRMQGKSTALGATDLGPIGGLMALKDEAENIYRAGVTYCAETTECDAAHVGSEAEAGSIATAASAMPASSAR